MVKREKKTKRRGGLLRNSNRMTKGVATLVLTVACASLAFTQLGFAGLGWNGTYTAYLIIELIPIAIAALLLGPLIATIMGAFAGSMLLLHATLMPINYYELTFVTPLTSIVMLSITGLLLGHLFKFVLRNDPGPVKTAIYITIVCVIVSWLYSLGFMVNSMLSFAFNFAESTVAAAAAGSQELTDAETARILNDRASSFFLRMGSISLQAWLDAVLMSLFCTITAFVTIRAQRNTETRGLRSTFATRLSVVVSVAFMITSAFSFVAITRGELADANNTMASELNYLSKQVENTDKRANSYLDLLLDSSKGLNLTDEQERDLIEGSTISGILDGYSAEDDGTILILWDSSSSLENESPAFSEPRYMVLLSDDDRFKQGQNIVDIAGSEIDLAIASSEASGTTSRATYDENYGKSLQELEEQEISTIRSEIVYIQAREVDDYTVAMMLPARKVYAGRTSVMIWTAISAFVLLGAVFAVVFLLLNRDVARRIDQTNSVLARITDGDLNATVNVRSPREFASLSDGVNETVTALKGWIAEAETRMDTELATAKAIQESALPSVFPPYPDIHKFDVYASMNPAREVGGDFYDFFLIGDECDADSGKLGFVIADVSGKGVPAALFMMKSMTLLRDYLKVGTEIGEALENANRQLCEGNDKGMFVTVWAGVLDYGTGTVEYANAGHNPPLLWQQDGGWRWLTEKSGLPLGLFEGLPYESYSVECGVGDQFLLYTDGVTEAMNVDGEQYGEDRLKALADQDYTMHPGMLVSAVRYAVAAWAEGAEQSDDITILSLEVGVPPEMTATLKLPALAENLLRVNNFIHGELDRRLCPKRVQNQLDIAVEELFVNVCHYAYPDATPEKPGTVRIQRTYSAEPPSIEVRIIDAGIPYNPLAKPDAVTPDNIADVPIGGLGILMAKKCTDKMDYEYTDGCNIVTIVKKW